MSEITASKCVKRASYTEQRILSLVGGSVLPRVLSACSERQVDFPYQEGVGEIIPENESGVLNPGDQFVHLFQDERRH
jgi:hypothetical protein